MPLDGEDGKVVLLPSLAIPSVGKMQAKDNSFMISHAVMDNKKPTYHDCALIGWEG